MPLFLIPFSAFLTQWRWLDFGINPNIFIAMLSAYAFFIDSRQIFILATLIGIIILKFKPVFEIASLGLALVGGLILLMRKALPVFGVVGVGFISAISTFLFYLLTNYNFIISHASILFLESLYNSVLSVAFYLIFKLIYGEER